MKHPMQKQTTDDSAVLRFVENKLVTWLVDRLPNGMNDIAREYFEGKYSQDDFDQILQQIGYSVSAIPYKDKEKYSITDNNRDPEEQFEIKYKALKKSLIPIVADLFCIAEEDLKS